MTMTDGGNSNNNGLQWLLMATMMDGNDGWQWWQQWMAMATTTTMDCNDGGLQRQW